MKIKLYIPPHFYYPKEEEGISLTERPTGVLSAAHKKQGHKKIWIDHCPVEVLSKKTLILNDGNLESSWEMATKRQILQQLLTEEGFEIWVCQDDRLIPLTPELLELAHFGSVAESIKDHLRETLVTAAKKHNLSHDTLVFLNEFQFDQLRTPVPLGYRVNLSAIRRDTETLMNIMKSYGENMMVVLDKISNDSLEQAQLCQSLTNQHAGLIENFTQLDFFDELRGISAIPATKNIVITRENLCFTIPIMYFSKIVCATLDYRQLAKDDIEYLLSIMPLLRKLKLSHCNTLFPEKITLPALTDLHLRVSHISATYLQALPDTAPQLQKLALPACEINSVPQNLCLPNLRELHLYSSNISTANLQTFLQATPQLQELGLWGCNEFGRDFTLQIALPKLEILDLGNTNISTANFQAFLQAAPLLQELTAPGSKAFGDGVILNDIHLERLVTLVCCQTAITAVNLRTLLRASPRLKKLQLIHMQADILQDNVLLKNVALPDLVEFHLRNSNISTTNLRTFVSAPSLQKLNLYGISLREDGASLENLSLLKLEQLILGPSRIALVHLRALLIAGPNLQTLDLTGYEPEENCSLEDICLAELRILDLSDSSVSPILLQQLLHASPKLQTLDLTRYESLQAFASLETSSHASIKQLKILEDASAHTIERLKSIFPKAEIACEAVDEYDEDSEADNSQTERDNTVPPFVIEDLYTEKLLETPFVYDPDANKDLSQNMVINQLSQYLRLSLPHKEPLIEAIQDGICHALAELYAHDMATWRDKLIALRSWNGQFESHSDEQEATLLGILVKVERFYGERSQPVQYTFLGDFLATYLQSNHSGCVLAGIDHSIAVAYNRHLQNWQIFDPSYPNGYKTLAWKEVIPTIHHSLGVLVSASGTIKTPFTLPPVDKNKFLEQGGFLLLRRQSQQHVLAQFLQEPLCVNTFTPRALRTLFLRVSTQQGKPVWLLGMCADFCRDFFLSCILYGLNEKRFSIDDFKQSLAALPEDEQQAIMTALHSSLTPELKSAIARREEHARLIQQYRGMFTDSQASSASADMATLIQNKESSLLIKTQSPEGNIACGLQLADAAKQSHTPYFAVNSDDDLYAPLEDFLSTCDTQGIISLDYANFPSAEIRRITNHLLDNTRRIGDRVIPDYIKIIGIHNVADITRAQGEGFYTRFDQHISYWEKPEALLQPIVIHSGYPEERENTCVINLYEGKDWKRRIRGSLQLQGSQYVYTEDVLLNALKAGKNIVIANPPQNNYAYNQFIQRLLHEEEVDSLHFSNTVFSFHAGYNWNSLRAMITFKSVDAAYFYHAHADYLLTPHSFHALLSHHHYTDTGHYYQGKGLLETTMLDAGQSFRLLLAAPLKPQQWAELLECAKKLRIRLHCCVLPTIKLPAELMAGNLSATAAETLYSSENTGEKRKRAQENTSSGSRLKKTRMVAHSAFIYSTDPDVTAKKLPANANDLIINITDMTETDLIQTIRLLPGATPDDLRFEEKDQLLQTALKNNAKAVFILTGHFKPSLLHALLPLIQHYPKRIKLITQEANRFAAFAPEHSIIEFKDRWECLNLTQKKLLQTMDKEALTALSYVQLRALAVFQKNHPENKDLKAPWDGYNKLAPFNPKDSLFNPDKAKTETIRFKKTRRAMVFNVLKHSPFVFIGGATGAGKSEFIKSVEAMYPGCVFYGKKSLRNWAHAKTRAYLFLDETNITRDNWSMLEGLFHRSPYVIVDGENIPVTANHKVICAGNPVGYGGSRHQPELFQRHGNTVLFPPLPVNVVYEDIVKPILNHSNISFCEKEVAETLLRAYGFLIALSRESLLVTPRQLKSVLMLTIAEYESCLQQGVILNGLEHSTVRQILKKNMRRILSPLAPESHRKQFDQTFELLPAMTQRTYTLGTLFVTPSRQEAVETIRSFLRLRAFRQCYFAELNAAQLQGDICSIVLEGLPVLGKTDFLHALMQEAQIPEADYASDSPQDNVYYYIPANLPFEEKERRLKQAFFAGNTVIMDEINGCPMMESLVNALLSGVTPDGLTPKKPGFLILGTQNPAFMGGGRQLQSPAEDQRLLKFIFGEYPVKELVDMLTGKGLKKQQARALAQVFTEKRQQWFRDNEHILYPDNAPPCLWDLFEKAEEILEQNRAATFNPSAFPGLQIFGLHASSPSSQASCSTPGLQQT